MLRKFSSLFRGLIFFTVIMLLVGCAETIDIEEYRRESPWPYYIYLPEGYSSELSWPLFIAVHGSSTDARGCWETWQRFADERQFILLCPELAGSDGRLQQLEGNQRLLDILGEVYEQYTVAPQIFLFGFSAGGQFVQGYAFMNPAYVVGTTVAAPGNNYPPTAGASHIPFLVIVGERDDAGNIGVARKLAANLETQGYFVELKELPGVGHAVTEEVVQETLSLFDRIVSPQ